MVATFNNSDAAVQAYELLRVSHYEDNKDKKLLGEFSFLNLDAKCAL